MLARLCRASLPTALAPGRRLVTLCFSVLHDRSSTSVFPVCPNGSGALTSPVGRCLHPSSHPGAKVMSAASDSTSTCMLSSGYTVRFLVCAVRPFHDRLCFGAWPELLQVGRWVVAGELTGWGQVRQVRTLPTTSGTVEARGLSGSAARGQKGGQRRRLRVPAGACQGRHA